MNCSNDRRRNRFSRKNLRLSLLGGLLMALLGVFGVTGAVAQGDRGDITGHVVDGKGAVVAGASIVVQNEETGVETQVKTNDAGDYDIPNLNPGKYTVAISASGFESYRLEHVQVDVGVRVQENTALKVGSTDTTITVKADIQQLDFTNGNLGMTIEEKTITDLPLIYGNSFALAYLTPGIVLSGVNPNQHVYDSGTSSVSVNGSALNSIDYKLDGAPDNRVRTTAFTPNSESISQYRNNTATYDATQGHSSGGFVNVQTKSGTDKFHGSLFGYYQNPNINANYWLLNSTTKQAKPLFVREGLGVGGPVIRQKLYFFYGYEHSRQGNPSNGQVNVPTEAEKSGDFSALLSLGSGTTCGTSPSVLTGSGVNPYQLYDPTSVVYNTTTKTYTRLCIPGNKVSQYTAINPIAKAVLALYPKANGGTAAIGTYGYSISEPDRYYGMIGRFDYNMGTRQSGYWHLLRSSRIQNKNLWFPPVSGTKLDYENYGAAWGHTYVLNSATILSGTLGYTRFTNRNVNIGQDEVTPTSIGMPAYLTNNLPGSAKALPYFTLTGYTTLNTATASAQFDDIWLGSIMLSRQQGSHFLRTGFEYRRYLTNGFSAGTENGTYTSQGNLATQASGTNNSVGSAGFSLAEFEFGMIDGGSQVQNSDYAGRSSWYSAYVQDDWRVSKRLTLNAGIRWEYESPLTERNNKMIVSFDPNVTNSATATAAATYASTTASMSSLLPSTISPTGGVIFAGTNGYGRSPYESPKTEFAPRVAFSFAIDPKTVVKGGYGVFFDSLQSFYLSGGNGGTLLMPQQGYQVTSSVTAPSYANGVMTVSSTLANPFTSGLSAVTGNKAGYNTALGSDIQFFQRKPSMPYNELWSLGLQRQIGGFILSATYVGNHGVHQPTVQLSTGTNYGGFNYNAIPQKYYSTVQNANDARETYYMSGSGGTVTNPFYGLLSSNSSQNLGSKTVSVAQLLRPYPEFYRVNAFTFNGMSIYHSGQLQLQRRFSSGLSTTQAFTWSKNLDGTVYLNDNDKTPWYGVSNNDRPLRYVGSVIYQLPWGHGRRWLAASHSAVAQIVGGWQIQGQYQIQSGQPLTFSGNDVYYGSNPGDSHWSRASFKKSQPMNGTQGGLWFNPANWLTAVGGPGVQAVTCPTYSPTAASPEPVCSYAFPNSYQVRRFPLRYSQLRSDHLNQGDMGIQRQFQIMELGALQFRGEMINILNHPVYSSPTSTDPSNTNFGRVVSQGNQPRVYQFAAFFRF